MKSDLRNGDKQTAYLKQIRQQTQDFETLQSIRFSTKVSKQILDTICVVSRSILSTYPPLFPVYGHMATPPASNVQLEAETLLRDQKRASASC